MAVINRADPPAVVVLTPVNGSVGEVVDGVLVVVVGATVVLVADVVVVVGLVVVVVVGLVVDQRLGGGIQGPAEKDLTGRAK